MLKRFSRVSSLTSLSRGLCAILQLACKRLCLRTLTWCGVDAAPHQVSYFSGKKCDPVADIRILPLDVNDKAWTVQFFNEHWGAPLIVAHGMVYRAEELPGFVAEYEGERVGMLTYHIAAGECEIVSLD